jgi:hypothetical protein
VPPFIRFIKYAVPVSGLENDTLIPVLGVPNIFNQKVIPGVYLSQS